MSRPEIALYKKLCNEYRRLLDKRQISYSIAQAYNPYENKVTERINGVLKQGFLIHRTGKNIKLM